MRPGDHPEFFRFPAPEGRSRESTIVLRRDGKFAHDGEVIEHPRMVSTFFSWIRRHPDDGRYILSNGYDWTYFTVEDAPFFVTQFTLDGQSARIELSDSTVEDLDFSSLSQDQEGALYCRVKNGTFDAKFSQATQLSLEPLVVEGPSGVGLQFTGRVWYPKTRST